MLRLGRCRRWLLPSGVALVAAGMSWIGYQYYWIYQRHAFLQTQLQVWQSTGVDAETAEWQLVEAPVGRNRVDQRAPGFLWVFGEQGYSELDVMIRDPEAEKHERRVRADGRGDIERARALFPEAEIAPCGWDRSPASQEGVITFVFVKVK